MLDARRLIGTHDVALVTLDTLRYDVARDALARGQTPALAALLPGGIWERRHTPGSFTYAAHHAFFAGFLPTPEGPGPHPRLFAARFPGSETTVDGTFVFDAPDLVTGFAGLGYHTVCIGGVGFFNQRSPLGRVLPGLFAESHWEESFGVTDPSSTENQVRRVLEVLDRLPADRRLFLFLNVSALHQPNRIYLRGCPRGLAGHPGRGPGLRRPLAPGGPVRPAAPGAGALHPLLRPRHRLRRRRLHRPPPRPCRRVDRPLRRIRAVSGGWPLMASTDRASLLTGTPYVAYAYGYPHKTAYRPPGTAEPARGRLGGGAARLPVPLPPRAVLRAAVRLLQPVHHHRRRPGPARPLSGGPPPPSRHGAGGSRSRAGDRRLFAARDRRWHADGA